MKSLRLRVTIMVTVMLIMLGPLLIAQKAIPPGSVLPVRLNTGLDTRHLRTGTVIRAEVMQDIPGTSVHKGAHVFGHVVTVSPTRLEIRFDTLETKQSRTPLNANLRALASALEVENAQVPENGGDRGLPSVLDQTTRQIGGEQVYRGGGHVVRGITTVGEPTPDGAVGRLNSNPPCGGSTTKQQTPQALWLFSTDACGLYGYDDLTIEHAGRTNPFGTIVLASRIGKLNIRTGSGLLLRVQGP